ncbi:MAG: hypothetical protein M1479_02285, partial [Actinobacteria bacterium]|nr:hypothetical protein [Actinomycetota bacterium]
MEFRYKKNMDDVVIRHGKLWTQNFTDRILIKIDIEGLYFMDFYVDQMQYSPDYKKLFNCYKVYYEKTAELLDDSIPVARASLGSAVSNYFGGELSFTSQGVYSLPIASNLRGFDFSKIKYDPDNKWIKYQMEMVRYFAENARGLFPVSITEVIMGLVFVDFIIGQNVYLEIYDNPQLVAKMIDKSVEFFIKYINDQRKYVERYRDGFFEMFFIWLPGNQIWNGVDVYGNCSPEIWRKFGKPYYEEIGKYFGGQFIHMHSNAIHLVKEVSNTKFITGISILDDFNTPRGFDKLDELHRDADGIPLQIMCTKDELLSGMKDKTLKRNVYYWCTS